MTAAGAGPSAAPPEGNELETTLLTALFNLSKASDLYETVDANGTPSIKMIDDRAPVVSDDTIWSDGWGSDEHTVYELPIATRRADHSAFPGMDSNHRVLCLSWNGLEKDLIFFLNNRGQPQRGLPRRIPGVGVHRWTEGCGDPRHREHRCPAPGGAQRGPVHQHRGHAHDALLPW